MKVLFLVLDGVSPRYVDEAVMPALASLADAGGWSREGGIGVMPTSTYPNHATFVTGVPPDQHGVVANEIPTADGPVPSWERGPCVPTLFDAMCAAGRRCAGVFGDYHLVGATGAIEADFLWPDVGFSDNVAVDLLGYAKDRETAARVREAIDSGAELVIAQLNKPDTAAHIFGPDSPEALRRYGRTDAYLGMLIESLRHEWHEWVVIVVSDHSQEAVTEPRPIDLRAAAAGLELGGLVLEDGAAAVAWGEMATDDRWMMEVPGIEGVLRLDDETVLAWAGAGRWFSAVELPVRGVHGSPRTAAQVAVVTGGHPAAQALGVEILHQRPSATRWAPTIAAMLGITAPADLPAGSGS
jgi:hypothetical protein